MKLHLGKLEKNNTMNLHLGKAIVNIFHICCIFIYVYREVFSNIHNMVIIPRKNLIIKFYRLKIFQ